MIDVSKYQDGHNGPLKKEFRDFLNEQRAKNGWSLKVLGERLGISGPFAHNILQNGSNITTVTTMPRIAEGIKRLQAGDTNLSGSNPMAGGITMREHSYHLRDDLRVNLRLPADLTEREAERLAMFIRSLAQ